MKMGGIYMATRSIKIIWKIITTENQSVLRDHGQFDTHDIFTSDGVESAGMEKSFYYHHG